MSQDIIISLIEKNLGDKRKALEYTNILLDLQFDYDITHSTTTAVTSAAEESSEETHNLARLIEFLAA